MQGRFSMPRWDEVQIINRRKSQFTLRLRSVYDREYFAICSSPNRTTTFPPEKIRRKRWLRRRAVIFSSPFRTTNIAKTVHFLHILPEIHHSLYPVQTSWRRERDSNPRYPFEYSGFQDRLFQPLTHPPAGEWWPWLHDTTVACDGRPATEVFLKWKTGVACLVAGSADARTLEDAAVAVVDHHFRYLAGSILVEFDGRLFRPQKELPIRSREQPVVVIAGQFEDETIVPEKNAGRAIEAGVLAGINGKRLRIQDRLLARCQLIEAVEAFHQIGRALELYQVTVVLPDLEGGQRCGG